MDNPHKLSLRTMLLVLFALVAVAAGNTSSTRQLDTSSLGQPVLGNTPGNKPPKVMLPGGPSIPIPTLPPRKTTVVRGVIDQICNARRGRVACALGLLCAASLCKMDVGGKCEKMEDCAGMLECLGGECVRNDKPGGMTPTPTPVRPVSSTPPPKPVLGPGECLSALDCSDGLTCIFLDSEKGKCQNPPTVGEKCSNECAEGAFCDFSGSEAVCKERAAKGGACQGSASDCVEGLVCATSGLCADALKLGDTCESSEQCGTAGFCLFDDFPGKCVAPLENGASCSDSDACGDGFCDFSVTNPICKPKGDTGSSCQQDESCQTDFMCVGDAFATTQFTGMCVASGDLIKKLGAPCDVTYNKCDDTNELICRDREGGAVCVQERSQFSLCDPSNPLQGCQQDSATKFFCQEQIDSNTRKPNGEFRCSEEPVIVGKGQICNAEDKARCAEDFDCGTVPGVGQSEFGKTRYCMEKIGLGEDCSDQFETTCSPDGMCESDVCVAAKSTPTPTQFAGLFDECTKVECARGLVCEGDDNFKQCVLTPAIVGEGEICGSNVTNTLNCAAGFGCISPTNPVDNDFTSRCIKRAPAGVECSGNDDECLDNLLCSDIDGQNGKGKCRDPSVGLARGVTCNPNATSPAARCGIEKDNFPRELTCGPEGSSFVCKRTLGLFDTCSGVADAVCEVGAACSATGVCETV